MPETPRQLDEATRPRVAGSIDLTPDQRVAGDHLRAIHDHFRGQLAAVAEAVAGVRRGDARVDDVRDAVHRLAPQVTERQLAGFCGQLCQFVTMHHTIEDRAMFPAVAAHPDYAPVAERLVDEHLVIHDLLLRVDQAAILVAADPTRMPELDVAFTELRRVLESHFTYEEEEMTEALGVLGLRV